MQPAPIPPPKTGRAAAAAAAAAALATAALPRMRALQLRWRDLDRQHHLHLLLPAALGLFFAFFGGTYCTLIIAVEAIRLSGWKQLVDPLSQLYSDAAAVAARIEQQQRDSRPPRIPAAAGLNLLLNPAECPAPALAALKRAGQAEQQQRDSSFAAAAIATFFREIDPARLGASLTALQACALAVAASLRVHFARAITLGASLADAAMPIITRQLLPHLQGALPQEYVRWAQPLMSWTTRAVAMWFAWLLQRAVSSVHSAITGGLMASRCIIAYVNARHITLGSGGRVLSIDCASSFNELLGGAIALLGLYFQFSQGFSPPFPLNIVLLPLTVVETCLVWLAGSQL